MKWVCEIAGAKPIPVPDDFEDRGQFRLAGWMPDIAGSSAQGKDEEQRASLDRQLGERNRRNT